MAEEIQKTAEQIAADKAAADKAAADKAAADKAAADKAAADKAAAKAKVGKQKGEGGPVVAVHKLVYGKDVTAPAGSIIKAGELSDTERAELIKLGAVREPEDAELAVAEAQVAATNDDPLG